MSKIIEEAVRNILLEIGGDPERQGLVKTPYRVAKMYKEVTTGYQADPYKIINNAIFDVDYDEMVVVANIEYYSLCEHHMLPFFGVVHVGYIPNQGISGANSAAVKESASPICSSWRPLPIKVNAMK
jgi:GTP cyclohydrolase I